MFNFFGKSVKKDDIISKPLTKLDYSQDSNFLNILIATYIGIEKFKLELSNRSLVNDNDIIDMAKNITTEVLSIISTEYKEILFHYINEDKFEDFIASIITQEVVKLGLEYNLKKM